MTPRRIVGVLAGLGIGLLFYLAHRSDRTVSNQVLSWLCGPGTYSQLKQEAKHWLPVPLALCGCLPSAMWCFIVTSLVRGWNLRIGSNCVLQLSRLGPLLNAALEAAQWIGLTDGHADELDVIAGFAGGLLAHWMFPNSRKPLDVPCSWNWRLGLVAAGFACVGFADVWK
jgi:hypothetical protein